VIAATNRELTLEMEAKRFREDLFYRIAVLMISTPPLRNRVSDIPLLIQHFLNEAQKRIKLSQQSTLDQVGIATLCAYPWPGNIRQLRHTIERMVATAEKGREINADDVFRALPTAALPNSVSQVPVMFHDNDSLDDFLDRTMLNLYEQLMAKCGSHSQTARVLRTDRASLYQRIDRARRRLGRFEPTAIRTAYRITTR